MTRSILFASNHSFPARIDGEEEEEEYAVVVFFFSIMTYNCG
jgi:hypothetical protein